MKTLITVLAFTPLVQAFAEEIPCNQLVARYEDTMNAIIQSQRNVSKRFGTSATNWTSLDALITSGAFRKKGYDYTGAAAEQASMDRQNQGTINHQIEQIVEEREVYKAALQKCLTPAQAPAQTGVSN